MPTPAPVVPATRLACPDGWTDAGSECTQSSPYTYTTRAYTYHRGIVGQVSVGECWIPNSTTGEMEHFDNCNEYVYGDVRDATPSGFEDTGTQWRKKDPAPSGWTDTGSGYERTTAKITVPA